MSPSKGSDYIIPEPENNHYVTQLSALPRSSSKSCAMLIPTASNQDPAPFFLLPPTLHQPNVLVLYFVISQIGSASPAFCFI